ncbi:DegT/DnrJ/EryC1/StrS family aminotransferase [Pseudodesulfovibrio sp.]|nr:DegT/DnrJ/EryC1/StrS family aminotransferase [Pseudodesulfovibrio sp.]
MPKIPLVDLSWQHEAIKDELHQAMADCMTRSSFIGGPDHVAFAEEFSEFCGGGHTALCGNGTDALYLAIVELIGHGDDTGEIVTVPNTFIATAEAIIRAGYKPVLCDVAEDTLLMDPASLEKVVSSKTRAIIPVHLFGQMCPMDKIMAVAEQHDLAVIEDAAQAHGATYKGKGVGHSGHAACFSFFPGKNLGALGDGGAVFSTDEDLISRVRVLANHGRQDKYLHERYGVNSRLDGLQAAVLRVKLGHLANWNQLRREAAARYAALLAGRADITLPHVAETAEHVFHLYAIRVADRDAILDAMKDEGVMAGVHYPVVLNKQPALQHYGQPTPTPVADAAADQLISLPIFPGITPAQVERVAEVLMAALDKAEAA